MKKVIGLLIAVTAAVLVLSACAAASDNWNQTVAAPSAPASAPGAWGSASAPAALGGAAGFWDTASREMRAVPEESVLFFERGMIYDDNSALMPEQGLTPRRIKIGSMSVEAVDVDEAAAAFENAALAFGGWIESRSISMGLHRHASLTLRVPANAYEDFVLTVTDIALVRHFNDHIIDATAEYFDAAANLSINRAEETRLLEFISNAEAIEDIIMLEARLSEVRTEIERHENNMRRIDRDVSYSTLHVNISERGAVVIRPLGASLGTRMGDGFTSSVYGVVNFMGNVMVFLAYISIPLVICTLCALTGVSVYRRRGRRVKV